jgi:pimeloyl-ACP methyl ester carboxylesterase
MFAQSCMKFRISDTKARSSFLKKGIQANFVTMEVSGIILHYVKTGSENLPTLFFIHGSPGSWDAFKEYMMDSTLLSHFRTISIDRPGFGYSNFGIAYNLQEQSDLIYNIIINETNNKPFHLVGHSIGGPVIVKLAQDHPDAIASISIISGSISPFDEPKELWRYAFRYSPLALLLPGAFRPSNNEILYLKKDLFVLDKYYERITMPVTFIHGDADKFVTIKNVAYGKNKLATKPFIKSIIIPGGSHFILWEHYKIIHQHLLSLNK